MNCRTVLSGLLIVGGLLAAVAIPARAQGKRSIQIALVDSLSAPGARAELLRFSDPGRPDIILLRAVGAAPADLAAALATLRSGTDRRPSRPGTIARTTIVGVGELGPEVASLRREAEALLSQVRRAPISRIGNLGNGRWSAFDVSN